MFSPYHADKTIKLEETPMDQLLAERLKWNWTYVLLLVIGGGYLLSGMNHWIALGLCFLVFMVCLHLTSEKKFQPWSKRIALISFILCFFTIKQCYQKEELNKQNEKTEKLYNEVMDLLKKDDPSSALKKLEQAIKSGENSDRIHDLHTDVTRATSKNEAAIFLSKMNEAEFKEFLKNGTLPPVSNFQNEVMNNTWKKTILGFKASAKELRKLGNKIENLGKKAAKKYLAEVAKAKAIVEEIGEAPKNSSWDGSVSIVKQALQINLKDPDSVEFISWGEPFLVKIDGRYYWAVRVNYRARNSFGGMVIEERVALIRNNQVISFEK